MGKIEEILRTRQFPQYSIQKDISGVYDHGLGRRVSSNLDREESVKRAGKQLCTPEEVCEEAQKRVDLENKGLDDYE